MLLETLKGIGADSKLLNFEKMDFRTLIPCQLPVTMIGKNFTMRLGNSCKLREIDERFDPQFIIDYFDKLENEISDPAKNNYELFDALKWNDDKIGNLKLQKFLAQDKGPMPNQSSTDAAKGSPEKLTQSQESKTQKICKYSLDGTSENFIEMCLKKSAEQRLEYNQLHNQPLIVICLEQILPLIRRLHLRGSEDIAFELVDIFSRFVPSDFIIVNVLPYLKDFIDHKLRPRKAIHTFGRIISRINYVTCNIEIKKIFEVYCKPVVAKCLPEKDKGVIMQAGSSSSDSLVAAFYSKAHAFIYFYKMLSVHEALKSILKKKENLLNNLEKSEVKGEAIDSGLKSKLTEELTAFKYEFESESLESVKNLISKSNEWILLRAEFNSNLRSLVLEKLEYLVGDIESTFTLSEKIGKMVG